MTEDELLDWHFHYVEGDISQERKILKIALCDSYQKKYTDIDTICKSAGLAPKQIEDVKRWKQHDTAIDEYIFYTLYDYLIYYERERFIKSLNIYQQQNSHF